MALSSKNYDFLIVGGGVIGLSIAWELAQRQAKVCVVDRGPLGREASWAGAGMIPPGPARQCWGAATPIERLETLSHEVHAEWHPKLLELTGIDNEYQLCGALQLALTSKQADKLEAKVLRWHNLGIECPPVEPDQLVQLEPCLADRAHRLQRIYYLPSEAQLRNPRHLRALLAACRQEGVQLEERVEVHDFEKQGSRVHSVLTTAGKISATQFCLAAGSWTAKLTRHLDLELPIQPVRGQIVLLQGPPGFVRRDINVGPRYLVPRRDGRVLIGSTQEHAGFVKETTPEAREQLLSLVGSLSPRLAELPVETQWAGLRPASPDGQPFLGRLPHWDNAWVAAGHFRAGLQLSAGTAVVMRALLLGEESAVDVSTLGVDRLQISNYLPS